MSSEVYHTHYGSSTTVFSSRGILPNAEGQICCWILWATCRRNGVLCLCQRLQIVCSGVLTHTLLRSSTRVCFNGNTTNTLSMSRKERLGQAQEWSLEYRQRLWIPWSIEPYRMLQCSLSITLWVCYSKGIVLDRTAGKAVLNWRIVWLISIVETRLTAIYSFCIAIEFQGFA